MVNVIKNKLAVSKIVKNNLKIKGDARRNYDTNKLDKSKTIEIVESKNSKVPLRFSLTIPIELDGSNDDKGTIIFIGMNPSAANLKFSDYTVNKFINYAKKNNYSTLIVLNTLPYYYTSTKDLIENFKDERTKPNSNLQEIINNNIETINEIFKDAINNCTIFLATGTPKVKEGAESLFQIEKIIANKPYTCISDGIDSTTKEGYTLHASRKSLENTDIKNC